ncbi:MAG TPA: M56 family metallopeptidase [Verrucomicrobiae bacterium]|jgi:beta-lactamase regulating signal transducer with metallopeptidase domain|nr:M56 family metallopeptidase [Verrucomicrobiae bacterium]
MNTWLAFGQTAFEWTWRTSLSAAVLVALVFLTQKFLGRLLTPRLRYTLSLLVLVRLLLPVAPASPLSLENLFHHHPALASYTPSSFTSAPIIPIPPTDDSHTTRLAAGSLIRSQTPPRLSGLAWASLIWAGGCFGLMMLAGWRYQQWNHLIAQGQPISDPHLPALLEGARADMGVRWPVWLLGLERLSSPAIFGLWRVRLLLPQSVINGLSQEELRMVFLHEMAHVRRRDVWLNFLLIAVQFLHWFNPLVWLANHRIRADRELVCDDMALNCLSAAERPNYGQVLLKLMDGFSSETPVFSGAIPVVGSKQEIKRRIVMIRNHGRGGVGAAIACLLAVAVLACATFTRAQGGAEGASGWASWNNNQKLGSFYAVAGTPRETVAVGIDGLIATRDNATGVWTKQVFTGDPDFRAIVYANNQYVIVREAGSIMTSPDGLKWTSRASPTKRNLLGVFWDGHQYLAGGDGGTILSSSDGINWVSRDSGRQINFYSFSYSGARYVAVGNDGICISSDSITWTTPTKTAHVPFTACTWTGTEFLACGLGLDRNPTIYTSPDGNVWTLRDRTIMASLRAAISVNGAIYVTGDGVIKKSVDGGTTWTDTFINSNHVNNLFMGLSSNGEFLLATGFNHNVWAMPVPAKP